ncbi:uncharacterized protein LOC123398746 isoform X2 [Hordeum vulgare subsp. vulgare]|uniref:uncharacterized protein LOC123398746 isoform X2 n=1 Tax=Hordeum vulgare subsp. vulgare TaxID=112509 RepID=UPI001D1A45E9|nr:uncharacterized protein LOC123398746 isoform X2 [Hordeum vulgare subsp. vulgare]
MCGGTAVPPHATHDSSSSPPPYILPLPRAAIFPTPLDFSSHSSTQLRHLRAMASPRRRRGNSMAYQRRDDNGGGSVAGTRGRRWCSRNGSVIAGAVTAQSIMVHDHHQDDVDNFVEPLPRNRAVSPGKEGDEKKKRVSCNRASQERLTILTKGLSEDQKKDAGEMRMMSLMDVL